MGNSLPIGFYTNDLKKSIDNLNIEIENLKKMLNQNNANLTKMHKSFVFPFAEHLPLTSLKNRIVNQTEFFDSDCDTEILLSEKESFVLKKNPGLVLLLEDRNFIVDSEHKFITFQR